MIPLFVYILLSVGLLTTSHGSSSMDSHVGAVRSEYTEMDELIFREKAVTVRGNTAIGKMGKLISLMVTISELESRYNGLIIELSEDHWNLVNQWWILIFKSDEGQSFENIVEEYACLYPDHVPAILRQLKFNLMDHIGRGEEELVRIEMERADIAGSMNAHIHGGLLATIDSDVDELIRIKGEIHNNFRLEFYFSNRAKQLREYITIDRVPRWENNSKGKWKQEKRDVLVQDIIQAFKNIVLGGNTIALEAVFRFEFSELMKKNKVYTYASLSHIVVEALGKFELLLEDTYSEAFDTAKRQYDLICELIRDLKGMKYALSRFL